MHKYEEAISKHLLAGHKVLPLEGKGCIVPEWQHREFKLNEILNLLAKYDNPAIGVQLGPKSGIIDFEFDSDAQREKLVEIFAGTDSLEKCPCYETKNGRHFWFAWDDRLELTNAAVIDIACGNGEKLKVRIGAGGKGALSVVPPSPNKVWLPGRSIFDMPLREANI